MGYLDQAGLAYLWEKIAAALEEKASAASVEQSLGEIAALLDALNGEVV